MVRRVWTASRNVLGAIAGGGDVEKDRRRRELKQAGVDVDVDADADADVKAEVVRRREVAAARQALLYPTPVTRTAWLAICK